MKKHFAIIILLAFLFVGFISVNAKASITIATFADPSEDSDHPLFTVDFRPTQMKLTGGWDDEKTGLTLQIPYNGHSFQDAWFEITNVNITSTFQTITPLGTFTCGNTSAGKIQFYEDNAEPETDDPLVVIEFESGSVWWYDFGADETSPLFGAANVTITGSQITGTLSEEEFTFPLANQAYLPGSTDWNDGFTATASFTSSAVPEPATVCLLGLGALGLVGRQKRL